MPGTLNGKVVIRRGNLLLYIIKFIYELLLPPGIFIILLFIVSIWLHRHHKKAARFLFIISVCLYLFSMQITGEILIHSLETIYQPPQTVAGDVIVMLGGGSTGGTLDVDGRGELSGFGANRLLTAARLYKKTHLPIIVSGGMVYKDSGNEADIAKRQLISLGIPGSSIIAENKSLNTEQNAQFTKRILKTKGFKKPILVTSAFHMERAVLDFSKAGVHVVPYPTDYQTNQQLSYYPSEFIPSDSMNTRLALKEYLGILAVSLK